VTFFQGDPFMGFSIFDSGGWRREKVLPLYGLIGARRAEEISNHGSTVIYTDSGTGFYRGTEGESYQKSLIPSQHYDRSVAIRPQNQMPIRPTASSGCDAKPAKAMMAKKFATFHSAQDVGLDQCGCGGLSGGDQTGRRCHRQTYYDVYDLMEQWCLA
jgi:hypothetical protein